MYRTIYMYAYTYTSYDPSIHNIDGSSSGHVKQRPPYLGKDADALLE